MNWYQLVVLVAMVFVVLLVYLLPQLPAPMLILKDKNKTENFKLKTNGKEGTKNETNECGIRERVAKTLK